MCALGSRLVVAGHRTWLELPWTLVDDLPLASHALPARAFVLVWLALAVIVALFLARGGRVRWLVFGLMALTLAPSLGRQPLGRRGSTARRCSRRIAGGRSSIRARTC